MSLRTSFLAGVLVAVLTGCGHGSDAPAVPRAEGLKTLTAGASGAAAGGLPPDVTVYRKPIPFHELHGYVQALIAQRRRLRNAG